MRAALVSVLVVLGSLDASADAIGQAPVPSPAISPSGKLGEARDLFRSKDYDHAAEKLSALLYPTEQLAMTGELVEAHLLLGVCFVETGRPGEAKDEFKQVLRLEPSKTLDPLQFSTNARRIFDETKSEVDDERRRLEIERQKEEDRLRVENYLKSLRPIEIHGIGENFAPFGGAQFLEHRTVAGIAFFSGETLTFGVSAGIWLYLAGKYGLQSTTVPAQDVPDVQRLEQIEIGAGALFLGLYAAGIVDSYLHFKPRVEISSDPSLLPPELRPKPVPKKTSLRDRLHIFPMPTRGGAGIGIGWEN
jgi:hypothetical protein